MAILCKTLGNAFLPKKRTTIVLVCAVPSRDCLLTQHAVPSDAQGELCSGRGLPVAACGTCECFTGYEGSACDECAGGYHLLNGLCQRTLDDILASSNSSTLSPQAAVSAASVSLSSCRLYQFPPDASFPS